MVSEKLTGTDSSGAAVTGMAAAAASSAPIGDMAILVGNSVLGGIGFGLMITIAVTVALAILGTTLSCLNTAVRVSYAMAQDAQLKDLTVEQANVAQAGIPRPGSLQVSLSADRADATYAIGDTVRLMLTANEDAFVTVLDVGPTGQVTQLFPNQYQTDNHVFANRPVEIGGGNSGAKVMVAGPVGAELVKVIASSKPVTVISESQLQGRGAFRTIDGGAQTVVRDLQVTADQAAQNDTRIALLNVPLRTVNSRVNPAPALIIVPGQSPAPQAAAASTLLPVAFPQPPAPSLVSIPAQQPFPLLIALDRSSYRIGDRVTLAVTALQACNLTVLDFTTSGQVRTLFPNPATPNNAVGAMQTALVAGGPSAVAFPVSGPAGVEQIVAVCSTDGAPAMTPPAAFSTDRAAAVRDLTVVVARQPGATAMASATFTVQP